MTNFKTVAKVGDIEIGQGKAFELDDQVVAVFRQSADTYLAIDDLCPHMGASLATGHFENGVVTCPWHAWSFDARDGAWCDNRRLKIATFDVRVVDGEIQLAAVDAGAADATGGPLGGASYGAIDSADTLPPESSADDSGAPS